MTDLAPSKIVAVHLNYRSRAEQRGRIPDSPSYFLKPPSSAAASGDELERPAGTELLAYEGEIALVIGTRVRRIAPADAWSAVAGITAANDFGVYDLRAADAGANLRAKGGDGFTPLGPRVLPAADLDPAALRVRTWVNGRLVQSDTTDTLLFPFGQLVADLSQLVTLEPGDVILTGTPAGSSVVGPGDVVEVEVDVPGASGALTTGRLRTPIVAGATPLAAYGAQPVVTDQLREQAWGRPVASGLASGLGLDVRRQLATVSTATLSAQLRRRGLHNVCIAGLLPTRTSPRMVGVAKTLRYVALREDLFAQYGGGYNAQKRAFDSVGSGEVIVIEARGERDSATVGDVLALRAQARGAAGIVTDGGVRDLAAVAALDLPTFHAGGHPGVLGRRHVPWEVDGTVCCGGVTVRPGDVLVGDDDGVVVIPPALLAEVLADALTQEREEEFVAEQVRGGAALPGLFPMDEQWRRRYDDGEGRDDPHT